MPLFGRQLAVTYRPLVRPEIARTEAVGTTERAETKRGDFSLDNILRLVPSDVVAIYLVAKGLQLSPVGTIPWTGFAFWTCLAVCVLLRVFASKPGEGFSLAGTNWTLVAVTTVAFFVWAHAVSDIGPVFASFGGAAAGFVAALFGVIAPKLVPAVPED